MSKDNVTRRISIFVNGKEVENSLKGVEGAMVHVRNKLRALNSDSENYDKDSKELAETMRQLREKQAQYREELGLTNKAMQDSGEVATGLRGTLSSIWDSLVSGDLEGAKEGISSLSSGMGGLLKSSLAFVATPIGAAIAGLAGLAKGAKELFDYNQELTKMNNELSALGVNASDLSTVRSEIQATAETFDKDFKEIAEKANSLSKTYGISMSEANDIIAQGLANGGAMNSEFLDSLGEYDEFFAKAGYSAQEFANIINTGYDLGIYSDKLPDALKEADLALKENTKSTRDALVNAFGASFSDEVLNKVKTGELTTKQALEAIAKKAQESNLSQQQYAQLTADVFKGAGEDAGGAQKIFEAIAQSTKREMSESAKITDQLREANERLNKAQAELFEIDGFGDIWSSIKIVAIDALTSLMEYLADVKQEAQPLIDLIGVVFVAVWENLKFTVGAVFEVVTGIVKSFVSYFSGIVQFWKKLLAGDFKGAFMALADGIGNAFKHIGNIFIGLYNNAIKLIQGIVDVASPLLETLGIDVEKLQKRLEGFKGKKFEIKGEIKTTTTNETKNTTPKTPVFGNGGGGATADALKAREKAEADAAAKRKAAEEKEAKEAFDRAVALAKAKQDLAKAQLDAFLANQRLYIDKEKALTPEILAMEEDRLDTIRNKKIEFNNNEYERKRADLIAKAELEKTSQQQLDLELETLFIENKTRNQQLDLEFQAQTDALKKQYEEEQKVLKAEQEMADYELQVAEAETKYQAELLRKQKAAEDEIKILTDKKNKGIINEDEYKRFVIAAQKEITDFKRQQTLSDLNTGLGALNNLAGAMGELFGQSKELAITQAIINGALAVTSILSAASMGNPILDAAVKAISIAAAVATTIANVNKIKNAKAPKKPNIKADSGFYSGGFTGSNPSLGYDEHGPVTGYVHKNEYVIPEVMTQDPRFANTIGWLEANRQKTLKGYAEGGSTSTTIPVNEINSSETSSSLYSAINTLNNILSSGIMAKVLIGYRDIEEMEKMKQDIQQSKTNGTIA